MEPWVVNKLIKSIENKQMIVLNASQALTLLETNHAHHDHDGHHHDDLDPHVWTSIKNASIMIDTILEALINLKPEFKETFEVNAINYKQQLNQLDEQFEELFNQFDNPILIHGGHAAIGYFVHDYNVQLATVFEGYSTNEAIKTSNIMELIELMKTHKQTVLFHEELIDSKSVSLIKSELANAGIDVKLKLFHALHNVSLEELENGETYLSIMTKNYQNVRLGLMANE